MKVSSKPNLSLEMHYCDREKELPDVFPFLNGCCTYFYSGRYALAAAMTALKLTPSQIVLLPAYNCWVEIDPFIRSGAKVDWYRVNKDFSIDVEDIFCRIRPETRAILIIHYFGFPQPLDEILKVCKERKIVLIEDCAHALLSNDGDTPLGSKGDMAIFSLRKTVPIPDGGCLLINNKELAFARDREIQPNRFSTYYVLSEMLVGGSTEENSWTDLISQTIFTLNLSVAKIARWGLRAAHKLLKDTGEYLFYPSGNHFWDEAKGWGMSKISLLILCNIDFKQIKARRRQNFQYLLEQLGASDKFSLPIRNLPDGVCPLLFPLIVDERDRIYREMKSRGISGHDWWGDFHPAVPWSNFSEVVDLKQNIFGIPVHQSLQKKDLDLIINNLEQLTISNGTNNDGR